MAAATRKRQRSAAAARPPRALFATALVTLAGWCSASSTKTDWANGVTPEWRHPAERRVSSNDANELIKLAKADAIATSLPSPRERPPPQPPLQHVSFKPAAPPLLRPPRAHQQHSMLYLDVFIDGHAVRAFVDTGAQVTVMSAPCAARCGLLGQLDKRYAGRAVGVGSARILGRIPDAHLRVANTYLSCAITVIEHAEMDLLLGLDMLRKYECDISLQRNSVRFSLPGRRPLEVAFLTRIEDDDGGGGGS
eukprot:TRINITY_DN8561_c0_g1_i2.p1 TRINITY_DN8561_c0_g1~~TRINITY_DN8561_c0_g1_i2.p1  ORF type:complete len:251 (+),score=107.34 TRINITY_DN8561_c0_g1_i2:117-869(+)